MSYWIGRWSAKGMVTVPDLSTSSRLQAEALLFANGLGANYLGTEETFNSNLGGKVSFQHIPSGTLVDYETVVNFRIYNYVMPPTFGAFSFTPTFGAFSFTPTFGAFSFTPSGGDCGPCVEYNYTAPTCNGEDSYVGNYTKTRKECPAGSGNWVDCTSATLVSFGECIATNVSSCGGSGGAGGPCPGTFSFTPSFGAFSFTPSPCGPCEDYGDTVIVPTCNGEDSYEGIFQPRRRNCGGVYEECQATFIGYGNLLESNTTSCGGSGTFSFTPSFGAFSFTPSFGAFSFTPTFGAFSFTPFGAFSFTPSFGAFSFTPSANPCPDPGSWSAWSACSNGTQTRTRSNYEYVGGNCIPFIEEESQSCTGGFSFTPSFGAFSFTPSGFSFTPSFGAFSFTPSFGAFSFTPEFGAFSFTPGFAFFNSIAVTTQILIAGVPGSSKPAGELQVGDKLLALNIPNPENVDWINWQSTDVSFNEDNIVETEIKSIQIVQEDEFIYIDGDLFSKSHYILVKKDNLTKFIKAVDVDTSYQIFSPVTKTFVDIQLVEVVYMNLSKVSINCEPYDNFFTTKMLVFDRPDTDMQ
jgi:hypothetical protein